MLLHRQDLAQPHGALDVFFPVLVKRREAMTFQRFESPLRNAGKLVGKPRGVIQGLGIMVNDPGFVPEKILRLGKQSFYRAQDMAFADAIEFLNSMLTLNLQAEDVAEGVSAFLQKRAPEWKGR